MPEFIAPVFELDAAERWRKERRALGQRLVFTNGCFDVLHAGHVEYLAWARSQGDALIVGLNSDSSVRALKGERRPLVTFADRAKLLCALRSVDAVVGFSEQTPEAAIARIEPDIFVKSSQYHEEDLPERHAVREHGGEIRFAPHVAGRSTTDIIAEILARYGS